MYGSEDKVEKCLISVDAVELTRLERDLKGGRNGGEAPAQ